MAKSARTYGEAQCKVCGTPFTKTHPRMLRCSEHRLNWSDPPPEPVPATADRVQAARAAQARTGLTTVAARYPGNCPLCQARFTVGDLISKTGPRTGWGHADCWEMEAMMASALAGGA